jgi:hypothetical protein
VNEKTSEYTAEANRTRDFCSCRHSQLPSSAFDEVIWITWGKRHFQPLFHDALPPQRDDWTLRRYCTSQSTWTPVDLGAAIAAGLRRDPLAASATCDLRFAGCGSLPVAAAHFHLLRPGSGGCVHFRRIIIGHFVAFMGSALWAIWTENSLLEWISENGHRCFQRIERSGEHWLSSTLRVFMETNEEKEYTSARSNVSPKLLLEGKAEQGKIIPSFKGPAHCSFSH